jgi:hypothetical protein
MRISELLRKLDDIRTASGDVRVLLPFGEFGFDDLAEVTVDSVYFEAFEGSTSGIHCRVSDADAYGSEFRSSPESGTAVILDTARPALRRAS